MNTSIKTLIAAICCTALATSCTNKTTEMAQTKLTTVGNPFMPLWEHIPDGEPYVFEDPDQPGKYRVYVYGSHDDLISEYCGRDQVVWSASVDSLNNWRYDGVILVVDKNANGEPFDAKGTADVLYAPDVTLVTDSTGKKTYYLFPNDQTGARNGLIAKSDRPDGPFEVCNWSKDNPNQVDGVLQFDPAVFVNDDGRVYGYWGFERSYAAEFDPKTMATVKPGTEIVEDMISGRYQEGKFRFFEASSIRKIKDKYVFIYSRFTEEGEFGLPMSNYTLAYAYSDNPLGPWTYGGTIIDGRAREKDEQGNVIASATPDGNTHGSICEINGQWYVFYHRQTGTDEYARQAMVAPIEVNVEEGPGGKGFIHAPGPVAHKIHRYVGKAKRLQFIRNDLSIVQDLLQFLRCHLDPGQSSAMDPHTQLMEPQVEEQLLRPVHHAEPRGRDFLSIGKARGQAGKRLLVPRRQSQRSGVLPDFPFVQACLPQRTGNPQFRNGPEARPVVAFIIQIGSFGNGCQTIVLCHLEDFFKKFMFAEVAPVDGIMGKTGNAEFL